MVQCVELLIVAHLKQLVQGFVDVVFLKRVRRQIGHDRREFLLHVVALQQCDKRLAFAAHVIPVQQVAQRVLVRAVAVKAPGILRVEEHEPPLTVAESADVLALVRIVAECLVVVSGPVLVCDEHLHAVVLHEIVDIHQLAELREGLVVREVPVVVFQHLCVVR